MTAQQTKQYSTDPLYIEAQYSFQRGEWQVGLEHLNRLMASFPGILDLQDLRDEMELRAKIDVISSQEKKRSVWRKTAIIGGRLLLVVLVLGFAFWGAYSYFDWMKTQLASARYSVGTEIHALELTAKFRNAQNLLAAGRHAEASALFAEIAVEAPDFPGLSDYYDQIEQMITLEAQYNEAVRLFDQGELIRAKEAFEAVAVRSPYYQDVDVRLAQIEQTFFLDEMLVSADRAFSQERWDAALEGYTNLRALDSKYKTAHVEDRLYQTYLKAAEAVLANPTGTLTDVEEAEGYFRKALALKPMDETVMLRRIEVKQALEERLFWTFVNTAHSVLAERSDNLEVLETAEYYFNQALNLRPDDTQTRIERDMARYFIKAQDDFNRSRWDEAIKNLEFVAGFDPNYAKGTARQTLYEAYLYRGDGALASGLYEQALSDYRSAAILAEQDSGAALRLYEVQVKLAIAEGLIGNHENAVRIFRNAIEASGLYEVALNEQTALANKIAEAERYAAAGNYRTAFRLYREAATMSDRVYESVVHLVVKGEYLTLIAARYGSTVNAIVDANGILNPNRIYEGQELIIPLLKGN
jgi:tetratricopeptide (TPR) repeat protein